MLRIEGRSHDAKMLVTPRGRDAIWGMAADKPVR